MQSLVIILFITATISFSLQIGLSKKWWTIWSSLLCIALFIYAFYPKAIEQSYTTFQEQLSNIPAVTDLVVVQVIEAICGIFLGIAMIGHQYGRKVNKVMGYFTYLPGLMIFPAIFYLESYAFLQINGISFSSLALLLSIFIPLSLLGVKVLLAKAIPETSLRLELKFSLHIIQLIIAIVLSTLAFRIPVKSSGIPIPGFQLVALATIVIAFSGIGMVWHNYKLDKHLKTIKNG